jgi:hypothetical protein
MTEANNDKREYHIVRFYAQEGKSCKHRPKGHPGNLTHTEAQRYCSREDTRKAGVWFDGYTKN